MLQNTTSSDWTAGWTIWQQVVYTGSGAHPPSYSLVLLLG